MHTQLLFSSPRLDPIFILLILPISFLISACYCEGADRFKECQQRNYSCGEDIREIGYPFWGDGRPQFCGHPKFELKCQKEDGYAVMQIEDRGFRVHEINNFNISGAMRIARLKKEEEYCPREFRNFTFDSGLFGYNAFPVENLTIFYDCSSIDPILYPHAFPCYVYYGTETFAFYVNDSYLRVHPPDGIKTSCGKSIKVLINSTTLTRLSNGSLDLQGALEQDFEVEYHPEVGDCLKCVGSGGLCGSDENNGFVCICKDPSEDPKLCRHRDTKSTWRIKLIIGILTSGTTSLACAFLIFWRKKKTCSNKSMLFWRKSSANNNVEAFLKINGSFVPKRYSYSSLKKITNSFREKLGQGGYDGVFKGKLVDGRVVAVKLLNETKGDGEEFINEVASISRTSHVNIVSLLGYCFQGHKRALIYEYMPNGSLEKFINTNKPHFDLEWKVMHKIALGVARGLEYLHRGCTTRIFHFDIKPHNILLDEDFSPKISDFGLAKLCPQKESIVSMLYARGTIGYIAPEVFSRQFGRVSNKADVYSYGMLLLDMVGGREKISECVSETTSEIYFPHSIYKKLDGDHLGIHGIASIEDEKIARKIIIIGLCCIQPNPVERPTINKVIEMLEGNLESLQIPPEPFLTSPSRALITSSNIRISDEIDESFKCDIE